MAEQKKRKRKKAIPVCGGTSLAYNWLAVRTQPPHRTNTSAILNTFINGADTGGFQRGDVTGVLANVDAVILGLGVAVGGRAS